MDITDLILEEHARMRELFGQIEQIDASETDALSAVWGRLRDLLDSHAEAEERFFYPRLLKVGDGANDADSAVEETDDAIGDHNDIRDTAAAVDKESVGSKAWFAAVGKCNVTNSKHLSEEERQAMPDFRRESTLQERHALAIQFLAFEKKNVTGVKPVNKDPDAYIEKHQKD